MRKCKWCNVDITNKRKNAIFCKRSCKGMFSRCEKNKRLKIEKDV